MKTIELDLQYHRSAEDCYMVPILGVDPTDDNVLIPVDNTCVETCREVCLERWRSFVETSVIGKKFIFPKSPGLIFCSGAEDFSRVPSYYEGLVCKKSVNAVLQILNDFEDKIGFTRTVAYPVRISGIVEEDPFYCDDDTLEDTEKLVELNDACFFVPDPRWFRYTYTMSLYALIIRNILNFSDLYDNLNVHTFDDLCEVAGANKPVFFSTFCTEGKYEQTDTWPTINKRILKIRRIPTIKNDIYYLFHTIAYWLPLMRKFENLFPKATIGKRFSQKHVLKRYGDGYINGICYEGIERLLFERDRCCYIRKKKVYKALKLKIEEN